MATTGADSPGDDAFVEAASKLTFDELSAAHDKIGHCDSRLYAITGFTYPLDDPNPLFYVKYSMHGLGEARTQQFIYESLQKKPENERQGVSVPRIYRILPSKNDRGYIVMEFIRGKTMKRLCQEAAERCQRDQIDCTDDVIGYYKRVSQGLKVLISIPPPPNATPGPVGGGYSRHPLFRDFDAPMEFDSIDTLELYVNRLATWFSKDNPTVKLERELVLVFSDLHKGNFIFTDDGGLCIIDFADAAFFPPSFLTYTLHCPRANLSIDVAAMVRGDFDLPMDNLQVLKRICRITTIPPVKLGFPEEVDRQCVERKRYV